MIETVDSLELADEINRRCKQIDKIMPILIEVNSGREPQKYGVLPEEAVELIRRISGLNNIKVKGLMTMAPLLETPGGLRPFFRETKSLFDQTAGLNIPGVEMRYLSMGMSDSYRVAIEEGANIVRIGSGIFGSRYA